MQTERLVLFFQLYPWHYYSRKIITEGPYRSPCTMIDPTMKQLATRVLERLRADGVQIRRVARRPSRRDELWQVGPQEARVRAARKEDVEGSATTDEKGTPILRIADHIPTGTGEIWIRKGWQFADSVGNAFLSVPGLTVRVLGKKPAVRSKPRSRKVTSREWYGASLKVLFHLLSEPQWIQLPYRELAKRCSVSTKSAVLLIDDLVRIGHADKQRDGTRHFFPSAPLYERWIAEYTRKIRPKSLVGSFTVAGSGELTQLDLARWGAAWGAEDAAARLGTSLRPAVHTVYVRANLPEILIEARLRPDPEGTVELRDAFWHESLRTETPDTTPVLLVVADLTAVRDARCDDAATEIMERIVDRPAQ